MNEIGFPKVRGRLRIPNLWFRLLFRITWEKNQGDPQWIPFDLWPFWPFWGLTYPGTRRLKWISHGLGRVKNSPIYGYKLLRIAYQMVV